MRGGKGGNGGHYAVFALLCPREDALATLRERDSKTKLKAPFS